MITKLNTDTVFQTDIKASYLPLTSIINETLTPIVEEKVVVDTPSKIQNMGAPGFLDSLINLGS